MNNYYENKLTYNKITFNLTNSPDIQEREMHAYHEILFYIDGDATFLCEGRQQKLSSNTLILIPKEAYHFFRLSEKCDFTRLKISFPESFIEETPLSEIISKITVIENPSEHISFALDKLCHILKGETTQASPFYAYAAFLMLLSELDSSPVEEAAHTKNDSATSKAIRYISKNLSGDLTIEALSKKLNISASTITHAFKNELGISLHEYVKEKRLVSARALISAGNKPSKIYTDCGYQDYSSFYKAYVSFFGYPPSKEKDNTL